MNFFKVSSQSYLAGLWKICFLCTYADQMIIHYWLVFCFRFSFTIFLLMFLPLFSKVVTNILKIYELPKICKILKKLFTIIIYQVNSMSKLHLASELYWKCTLGAKDSFGTKLRKILGRIFFLKCSAKRVLPFCCIRCCPYSLQ